MKKERLYRNPLLQKNQDNTVKQAFIASANVQLCAPTRSSIQQQVCSAHFPFVWYRQYWHRQAAFVYGNFFARSAFCPAAFNSSVKVIPSLFFSSYIKSSFSNKKAGYISAFKRLYSRLYFFNIE